MPGQIRHRTPATIRRPPRRMEQVNNVALTEMHVHSPTLVQPALAWPDAPLHRQPETETRTSVLHMPRCTRPGAALIAHYLDPDRPPAAKRWSRKHAHTQRRLCERFAAPVIAAVTCLLVRIGDRPMSTRNIKTLMMEPASSSTATGKTTRPSSSAPASSERVPPLTPTTGEARRALLAFVEGLVGHVTGTTLKEPDWMDELQERPRADGLDLHKETGSGPSRYGSGYKLLPTDPAPVALSEEITALESDLTGPRLYHRPELLPAHGRRTRQREVRVG
jgi:hypothetical protein